MGKMNEYTSTISMSPSSIFCPSFMTVKTFLYVAMYMSLCKNVFYDHNCV